MAAIKEDATLQGSIIDIIPSKVHEYMSDVR